MKRRLIFAEAEAAGCLTYPEAQKPYGIGYARWWKPREERGFLPCTGTGHGKRDEEQADL